MTTIIYPEPPNREPKRVRFEISSDGSEFSAWPIEAIREDVRRRFGDGGPTGSAMVR